MPGLERSWPPVSCTPCNIAQVDCLYQRCTLRRRRIPSREAVSMLAVLSRPTASPCLAPPCLWRRCVVWSHCFRRFVFHSRHLSGHTPRPILETLSRKQGVLVAVVDAIWRRHVPAGTTATTTDTGTIEYSTDIGIRIGGYSHAKQFRWHYAGRRHYSIGTIAEPPLH